jgi:hypothetical protein
MENFWKTVAEINAEKTQKTKTLKDSWEWRENSGECSHADAIRFGKKIPYLQTLHYFPTHCPQPPEAGDV